MKLIPTRVRESKAWQESEFDSRGHFHREGFNPAAGSPVPKKDVFYWPLHVVYQLLGNALHNGVTKPSEDSPQGRLLDTTFYAHRHFGQAVHEPWKMQIYEKREMDPGESSSVDPFDIPLFRFILIS